MECLKCGRETVGNEVFCSECLKGMEESPVAPNTPVVIHHRETSQRKAPQKKAPKPEEIITGLNKKIHRLRIAVLTLVVLFAVSAGALGYMVWAHLEDLDTGFNYSTVTLPSEEGSR